MLSWKKNLFIGEGIGDFLKIQKKINSGKAVPGIYLLTLSENPGNLMEIIPALTLLQKAAFEQCPCIIGMAKGKDRAIELTVRILEESYRQTGGFQIEEYMKNR